jgi:hypothetical protein
MNQLYAANIVLAVYFINIIFPLSRFIYTKNGNNGHF